MRRMWILALVLVAIGGCGEGPQPQALPSGGRWDSRFSLSSNESFTLVLMLDDSPSDAAKALRGALEDPIRSTFERLHERASWLEDPAAWHPVDWSVLVALPSREGSERWLGPIERRVNLPSEAEREGFVAEIVQSVAEHPAPGRAAFRPVETAHDVVTLLTGGRQPVDEHEAQVREALDRTERRWITLMMAATRDDQSPGAPADHPLGKEWSDGDGLVDVALVVPSSDESECGGHSWPDDVDMPRLEAWSEGQRDVSFRVFGWPCGRGELELGGLFPFSYGASGICAPRPIVERADGSAACRVWVEALAPEASCASYGRSWREPSAARGLPRDLRGRFCEVPELEGAALESCRTRVDCEGCGHGWCRTALRGEGAPGDYECEHGAISSHLRFVGGAVAGSATTFRIICALE